MTGTLLIIRDLPGIANLEVQLLLQRKAFDDAAEEFCKRVALELFGVWMSPESDLFRKHYDDLFFAYELADDEMMGAMLTLGVDFSNEHGHPLRCTLLLAGSAEVAVRGFAGKIPEAPDRFASNLERDRDAFIASKRGARP